MTSRFSRKAVGVGVAAIVGIGGGAAGVAYAYPSGVPLTVSASATRVSDTQSTVMVSLGNADPLFQPRLTINGTEFVLSAGQTTFSGTVSTGAGRNRVRARSVNCALKESARVDFVVPNAQLTGPTSGTVNSRARFELSGLEPGTSVTVTAVRSGGGATYSDTDDVDRRGEASVRLRFRQAGTYAVTATVNGSVVASRQIEIVG